MAAVEAWQLTFSQASIIYIIYLAATILKVTTLRDHHKSSPAPHETTTFNLVSFPPLPSQTNTITES